MAHGFARRYRRPVARLSVRISLIHNEKHEIERMQQRLFLPFFFLYLAKTPRFRLFLWIND